MSFVGQIFDSRFTAGFIKDVRFFQLLNRLWGLHGWGWKKTVHRQSHFQGSKDYAIQFMKKNPRRKNKRHFRSSLETGIK